jgi:outer membrane protein assembly factor BamB
MSNDCREFRGQAAAAALGTLSGEELERFQRHLAGCPSCHAEFERSRRTLELAAAGAAASVPANLAGRVAAAGREELFAESRRRRARLWIASAAGAAAALVLAAGLVWRANRPAPVPGCGCWRFVDGDSGNSRQADASAALVPERVAWEQRLSGIPGSFKPLAWRDFVVVGADPAKRTHRGGGRLVSFGAADGKVRWERDFPAGDFYKAKGFPDRCILGGRLYLTDGQACLVLDAATGRDLGRLEAPELARGWSYLAASAGRLYGAARDGRTVFCVESATGRTVWARPVEGGVFLPALSDGRMHLASGTGELAALDADTGAVLWRREGAVPAGKASLHARGGLVLVLAENDELLAFDSVDGGLAWSRRETGAFASGLAFGSDAVFLRGGSLAVRLADGKTLWQQLDATGSLCAAPTAAGGGVLATAGEKAGSLSAIEGASGKSLGRLADAAVRSCDGAIVAGGRIFTVADGRLLAVTCRPKG